ncbi:hypothetical protein LCGC14_0496780 [marine sediment metagenome]|uniref:Methylated-DNA-[protein]-cysteine S-methyltransferase DNA binding domain-containing protein n=1 Tax=marine sediment metagenome TaxID=412755 RepID=A0A0F9R1Q8_9ZZZZ|nr:MAG: Methylated-DNA--protein-cysteine methyltransferase, constitutive [Candidatus Lokiarchaeum sp. GC14_75]
MNIIHSIYFRSDELDAVILISFRCFEENKNTILDQVKFFVNETDAMNYILREKLELFKDNSFTDCKEILALKNLILNYLSGKNLNLIDKIKGLNINLAEEEKFPTEFSRDVIRSLINLDHGEKTTYSEIGEKIGSKAYRAIGNVLRKNPIPLIIPCHRVLKKNGDIGGFMGESDKGWQVNLKKVLLKIEELN